MKIKIKDKTVELKNTFRTMMCFENMAEAYLANGMDLTSGQMTIAAAYFYCNIITSDDLDDLTFDEFLDWLDANPDEFLKYNKWLDKQKFIQKIMSPKLEEKKTK